MELWNSVSNPPESALKTIGGGRLKGMTDINPQWRLKIMTQTCGPCGIGWKYIIDKQWTEPGNSGQIMVFTNISLFIKVSDKWSDAIPGTGGSTLVAQESAGLRCNDEGFKMSLTDALSVAMKQLGVGSAIYEGRWDGSKYRDEPEIAGKAPLTQDNSRPPTTTPGNPKDAPIPSVRSVNQQLAGQTNAERAVSGKIKSSEYDKLKALLLAKNIPMKNWKLWLNDIYNFAGIAEITIDAYDGILQAVEKTPEQIINYKYRER